MAGLEPDVARSTAGGGKKAKVERVWHEPEVTSRDVSQQGCVPTPSAVSAVRKLAEGEGWKVELTYARGDTPPTTQSDGKLMHSLALRMDRDDERVVAVWHAAAIGADGGRIAVTKGWAVRSGLADMEEFGGLSWSFDIALTCRIGLGGGCYLVKLGAKDVKKVLKGESIGGPTPEAVEALRGLVA